MKRLLTILSILITLQAAGQEPIPNQTFRERYYKFSKYLAADSGLMLPLRDTTFTPFRPSLTMSGNTLYVYDGNSWRAVGGGGGGSFPTVATVDEMINYSGSNVIVVTDSLQGGLFSYSNAALSADSGVIFPREAGGYWVRQYDRSLGVNVDWWGSRDSYSILKAVEFAGQNGTINFTPGKLYEQYDAIEPQSGQTYHGNRATLKRMPMDIVELAQDADPADTFIVASSVPETWKVGDYIGLFTDSTRANLPIHFARGITRINADTLFLDRPLNFEKPSTTTLLAGENSIWKVFHQFNSIVPDTLGTNWVYPNHYQIDNLIFDGNKENTSDNLSWYFNNAIFNMGFQVKLFQCEFYNMPSDAINGHGYLIIGCVGKNLNASFYHISKHAYLLPDEYAGTIMMGCTTDSTNLKYLENGHARGVVEVSNSSGFFIISDNRFYNGNSPAFGGFNTSAMNSRSLGTRQFILTDNYFKNFDGVLGSVSPGSSAAYYNPGSFLISGNIFDGCGSQDWTSQKDAIDTYAPYMIFGDNIFINGTEFKWPVLMADSAQRYVLNNDSSNPQPATINITGTASGAPAVSGNDFTTLGQVLDSIGLQTIAVLQTDQTAPSTEASLWEVDIPAGTLGNDGDRLELMYAGTFTGNGTVKLTLGGQVIYNQGSGASNGSVELRVTLIRVSATAARAIATFTGDGGGFDREIEDLSGLDFNTTQALDFLGSNGGTGDMILKMGTITYYPAL